MNEAQEIYCDGAAMAYRDVADQIEGMISRAPDDIKNYLMAALLPLGEACKVKADAVYKECERFTGARQ